MTGVAWPSVRDTFHLRQGAVGLVLVVSGIGYLISSFLSGQLTQAIGIGLLLAGSTGMVAAAMYGFAFAPLWLGFVLSALLHGLGSGAIDSGLNGYSASHVGPTHDLVARVLLLWSVDRTCADVEGTRPGPSLQRWLLNYRKHDAAAGSPVSDDTTTLGRDRILRTSNPRAPPGKWCPATPDGVDADGDLLLYTGLEVTFSQWTYTVLTEFVPSVRKRLELLWEATGERSGLVVSSPVPWRTVLD
ncbi:MAG: hypothetical protein R3C02_06850 [Planctomycetaceae bacterium]